LADYRLVRKASYNKSNDNNTSSNNNNKDKDKLSRSPKYKRATTKSSRRDDFPADLRWLESDAQ
jgi:hypothetical protein